MVILILIGHVKLLLGLVDGGAFDLTEGVQEAARAMALGLCVQLLWLLWLSTQSILLMISSMGR